MQRHSSHFGSLKSKLFKVRVKKLTTDKIANFITRTACRRRSCTGGKGGKAIGVNYRKRHISRSKLFFQHKELTIN